jgi:hypothetical protein
MRAMDRDHLGLAQAVCHARTRGFSWARIGVILGVSEREARQRFDAVDEQLSSQGAQVPQDTASLPKVVKHAPVELAPLSVMEPQSPPVAPTYDFSSLNTLAIDEVAAMASQFPRGKYLLDAYLIALREAIVITLYKRGLSQSKIAVHIGKSSQRVSQIIAGYYDRIERQWAEERAQWGDK